MVFRTLSSEKTFVSSLIVCFFISACVCSYLISKTIVGYFEYETVSKVETVFEVPTIFPTVSICNMNPFMTEKGLNYVRNYLESNSLSDFELVMSQQFSDTMLLLRYAIGASLRNSTISDEMRQEMGLRLRDMLLLCNYNQFYCDHTDFEWYYDTLFGSCYSFNSGKNALGQDQELKRTTKPGPLNGLTLELFVGNPTDKYSLSYLKGLNIQVHNKSKKPTFFDGFSANVGEYTKVSISREFSSKLANPFSDCVKANYNVFETSLYARTLLDANLTYRQDDCFSVCFQKYVTQNCSCYLAEFPFWNKTSFEPCQTFDKIRCFIDEYLKFFNSDIEKLCSYECPPECDSVLYQQSISTSQYPSDAYAKFLQKNNRVQSVFNKTNITMEELKSNLLSVSIYYSDLRFRTVSEAEKMGIIDLISSVGGTLGLFLGMSFLSFVEIVDLFFNLLIALCSCSKNKIFY